MRKLSELQQEIESVRFELDQALLRQDKFDNYYQKSTKLDQLIEEYIEEKEVSREEWKIMPNQEITGLALFFCAKILIFS